MTLLYIDTNVILDVVKGRKNLFGKDLSKKASLLFESVLSCKYYILISDWTLKELSKFVTLSKCNLFFTLLKNKTKKASYSDEDIKLAKKKSPENFDDALHVVIAEREKVDYIVTRNIKHFEELTNLNIKKPEELV